MVNSFKSGSFWASSLGKKRINFFFLFLLLRPSVSAWSANVGISDSKLTPSVNCEKFCHIFKNSPEKLGTPVGLPQPVLQDTSQKQEGTENSIQSISSIQLSQEEWSEKDTALCAQLKQPLGTLVEQRSASSISPLSKEYVNYKCSVSTGSSCGVFQLTEELVKKLGLPTYPPKNPDASNPVCSFLSQVFDRCRFYNTQVEAHCLVYNALTEKQGGYRQADLGLAVADFGVAAACAAACAVPANVPAALLCDVASLAVGAAEIALIRQISFSPMNQFINQHGQGIQSSTEADIGLLLAGLGTAAGGAMGLTHLGLAACNNVNVPGCEKYQQQQLQEKKLEESRQQQIIDRQNRINELQNEIQNEINKQNPPHVVDPNKTKAPPSDGTSSTSPEETPNEKRQALEKERDELMDKQKEALEKNGQGMKNLQRGMSCATAAIFTALGGIRTASYLKLGGSQKKSCEAIQELASVNPSVTQCNNMSTGYSSSNPSSSNNSGSQSGGGISSTSSVAPLTQRQQAVYDSCMAQPNASQATCGLQASLSATSSESALDSSFFSSQPPGALSPFLKSSPEDFAQVIKRDGVGNAVGSLMSQAGAGPLAGELSFLAQSAHDQSGSLSTSFGIRSQETNAVYQSSGGGTKSGSLSSWSAPLFNSFSGSSLGGGMNSPQNSLEFKGTGSETVDIFHSHTTDNIFEIVSKKISSTQQHPF